MFRICAKNFRRKTCEKGVLRILQEEKGLLESQEIDCQMMLNML